MNQTVPVTTTINSDLWNYVKTEARARKLNYNRILEEAIGNYKKEKLKEQIKEAFTDPERVKEYKKTAEDFREVQITSLSEN